MDRRSLRLFFLCGVLCVFIVVLVLIKFAPSLPSQKTCTDNNYDNLRHKWEHSITGGSTYDSFDPDYRGVVGRIVADAQTPWNSLNKNADRTYLWEDLQGANSAYITEEYTRLRAMALAYRTYGSGLYNNTALRDDTIAALDWMYAHRYNQRIHRYGNWWDWEIGAPLKLNDTTILLYDSLTPKQRANYMAAVDRFSPVVNATSANRVWKATVIGVRGVIVKDGKKIANARDGLSEIFKYATISDGFYTDGSYIQHYRLAYTGGYGNSLLHDVSNLLYLLDGSVWCVKDPQVANVYQWVYNSFEPVMYKGAIMDMTMGRVISRPNFQDHVIGHEIIRAVIRLSQIAPPDDALNFKRMAKEWIQTDTSLNYYSDASMDMAILGKQILNDNAISPRGELTKNVQFNNMARTSHFRPGFAFGISMYSNRIANYDSINSENLRGWHLADGMTYLYNGDLTQYSDAFWPTVNSYRLPGTTVESNTKIRQNQVSDQPWVGGTELLGYGVTGMAIHPPGQTLTGKKSWFMFDDEIVALGAGISDQSDKDVETIVENRRLTTSGDNILTVDGVVKPSYLPWSQNMSGIHWAHLAGNTPGSDIGYFFPKSGNITGLRESRTDSWTSINDTPPFIDPTKYTRNYLNLVIDHGINPNNDTYSYALLPNMTSAQVRDYARNPEFTILRNDSKGQAVRENTLHITAANFWVGGLTIGDIRSDKQAAVMIKETDGAIDISVADPTFANTGTLTIEIMGRGGEILSKDPAITVKQTAPTIKFTVNAKDLNGKNVKISLAAP